MKDGIAEVLAFLVDHHGEFHLVFDAPSGSFILDARCRKDGKVYAMSRSFMDRDVRCSKPENVPKFIGEYIWEIGLKLEDMIRHPDVSFRRPSPNPGE